MTESTPINPRESRFSRRFSVVFGISSLIAVVLLVGGVLLIHGRAAAVLSLNAAPLVAVEAVQVTRSTSYTLNRRYTGRIEPARQTELAFELGGTVSNVLVDEGAVVSKGQVLAELDNQALQAEKRSQQASKQALLSDLERAHLTLKRQMRLKNNGFSAEEKLDGARLDVARNIALIDQVDAALSMIEVSLAKAKLISPYDARIGNRMIDEGAIAAAGSPVFTLFETGNPTVRIGLAPQHSSALSRDREYRVYSAGNSYVATLLTNRPDVSTRTRTVDAQFSLKTGETTAPPFGEIADVEFDEIIEKTGYWVPVSALTEGDRGLWSVLLTVNETEEDSYRIVREQVELEHVDGTEAYILGTLPETFTLVKSGAHRVVAGQKVQLAQVKQ